MARLYHCLRLISAYSLISTKDHSVLFIILRYFRWYYLRTNQQYLSITHKIIEDKRTVSFAIDKTLLH